MRPQEYRLLKSTFVGLGEDLLRRFENVYDRKGMDFMEHCHQNMLEALKKTVRSLDKDVKQGKTEEIYSGLIDVAVVTYMFTLNTKRS